MPSPLSSSASASTAVPYPPSPSNETLTAVFEAYTAKRLVRTSALVKGARVQGELRLVHGVDACVARNNKVRAIWHDSGAMIKGYAAVWKGSFDDNAGEEELLLKMSNHK